MARYPYAKECKKLKADLKAEKKQVRLIEKQCQKNGERAVNLQVETERLNECITEIEAIACGEEQIQADGFYNDSDGLKWIYDRIQTLKRRV